MARLASSRPATKIEVYLLLKNRFSGNVYNLIYELHLNIHKTKKRGGEEEERYLTVTNGKIYFLDYQQFFLFLPPRLRAFFQSIFREV